MKLSFHPDFRTVVAYCSLSPRRCNFGPASQMVDRLVYSTLASARKITFSVVFVCLFVCKQDYLKRNERICMKFSAEVCS